jgi:hypothetical protein
MKAVLVGLHELRVLRTANPSTETCVFLAFQLQALLQRTDELVRNDQLITTRELETEISVSKGSVNNIIYTLVYSKVCSCLIPWHKIVTKLCGKMCVHVGSSFKKLMVKAFCHGSSLGMKCGSITLNRRQRSRDIQWNCIIQFLLRRSSRGYLFSIHKIVVFLRITRKLLSKMPFCGGRAVTVIVKKDVALGSLCTAQYYSTNLKWWSVPIILYH